MKIHDIITEAIPGIFMGPLGKGWNKKKAQQALDMEKAGKDRDDIWFTTGTFRNSNGDWRQEISDKYLDFNPGDYEDGKTYTMRDMVKHDELFKNYPQLKNMKVRVISQAQAAAMGERPTVHGWYDQSADGKEIVLVRGKGFNRTTLAHELEHAVQSIEKPADFYSELQWQEIAKKYNFKNPDKPNQSADFRQYLSWHREMDARLVQDRLGFEDWQRKMHTPTQTDTKYAIVQKRKLGPQGGDYRPTGTTGDQRNPMTRIKNVHYKTNPVLGVSVNDPMQDNPANHANRGTVAPVMRNWDDWAGDNRKWNKSQPDAIVNKNNNAAQQVNKNVAKPGTDAYKGPGSGRGSNKK